MNRIAGKEEYPEVVGTPLVVRVTVVGVEPPVVVIVFDVEHVRIAVRVHLRTDDLPKHCPLNTLRAVSYSSSIMT
ncbi:hypothetical protein CO057_02725 [Candidatus Uhrbacteria bacterium CG_4_9_14_0_2_um_filter_41_50]|uniref:Uncharacterized protein n=1 Tax=Candidatus Uhrbacteria bacterium CG_4_9_14_0_2_um_filter_41_50 TaxID=1975031 RepID=A0A2M8EP05_9BACT|nr:MAG: hypothetical protein COZ45_02590 [Candidatus Uhrbacteria bacterium CG_4_10_14_3_um_filter_41_21]PIZ54774.1 MAG: hypothetical protein COY24_02615 [Candidatus Uhrbacteria bacterium CG_4_10_14_0_2_um_filter_41_21]PJB84483.1 MAG: hypothetical protein CO086_03245 [Candidatus Uhrbacteria bacterium CG_4_9_14_0_8_um_filter_41_16]PJC24431.1 MAG: hypothetical protein CO057_02725 [Candidatus Uhrbacteria bacterium CG_4_9_14_0_2_um_filter_41_50]